MSHAILRNGKAQGCKCDCIACNALRHGMLAGMAQGDRRDYGIMLRASHRKAGSWSLEDRRTLQAGVSFVRTKV